MSHPRLAAYLLDAGRHNFYHGIHKALRLGHCRMLAELGAHDYSNAGETAALLQKLRGLIGLGRSHLEGENREIHAALEARQPGITAYAAAEHAAHEQAFAELESLIRAVEVAIPERRPLAGQALYQRYGLCAAADMEQMYLEETEVLSALHSAFSDAELMAIEARMLAGIAPDKMAAYTALLMPALSPAERLEQLQKLRRDLPDQAFDGLLTGTIQLSLTPQDYAAAMGALMRGAA